MATTRRPGHSLVTLGLAIAVASIVWGLGAPLPASAYHLGGLTYKGPVSGGGEITFSLSGDGQTITSVALSDISADWGLGTCKLRLSSPSRFSIPVNSESGGNHTFTASGSGRSGVMDEMPYSFTLTGSFTAGGRAEGTLKASVTGPTSLVPCSTDTLGWSATPVDAPPGAASTPVAYVGAVEGGPALRVTVNADHTWMHQFEMQESAADAIVLPSACGLETNRWADHVRRSEIPHGSGMRFADGTFSLSRFEGPPYRPLREVRVSGTFSEGRVDGTIALIVPERPECGAEVAWSATR